MNRRAWFLAALGPQLAFVGLLVVQGENARNDGTRVLLSVSATTPSDPMLGRFLRLDYGIAHVRSDFGPLDAVLAAPPGATLYVELGEGGEVWDAIGYALEPTPDADIVVRGTLVRADTSTVEVRYGFDRFYVPQDSVPLHAVLPSRLRAVVRVAPDGDAVVEDVTVDGLGYLAWSADERARGEPARATEDER